MTLILPFDVNETLLDLSTLDARFEEVFGDSSVRATAAAFLEALIETVPYTIHTVLTDNGVQFCDMPSRRSEPTARYRLHTFDRICREHDIEHRLTKPDHPWTNGQVEQMPRGLSRPAARMPAHSGARLLRSRHGRGPRG